MPAAARKGRLEEIGDESRQRILDAAEELFAERGYERTSFVDIVERSGISRGSIPWHFKNKDGLLIAVVGRALSRATLNSTSSAQGDVRGMIEDIKTWMHHPTAAIQYTLLAQAFSSQGDLRTRFVEYHRKGRARLRTVLQAAGADDESADLDVLVTIINGALLGLHLQWTLDDTVDLDAGLDRLGRLIEQGIRREPAAEATPRRRVRRMRGDS